MGKNLNFTGILILLVVIPFVNIYSGVPAKINFQGRLEESGQAVNESRSMVFTIYDVETGGSSLWTSQPNNVLITNGLFSVNLETGTLSNISTATFSGARYVEVSVEGVTLLPRQEIISAPYALVAQTLADKGCLNNQILKWDLANEGWGCADSVASSISAGDYLNDVKVSSAIYASNADTKVSKGGDTMSGALKIIGSSVTVITADTASSSMWVSTSATIPHFFVSTSGNVGVGLASPNSKLQVAGSIATNVVTVTSNYTVKADDSVVICDTDAGDIELRLPSAAGIKGRQYTIKQINGNVDTLSIVTSGTETIDGASANPGDFFLANSEAIVIISNGSNWVILSYAFL